MADKVEELLALFYAVHHNHDLSLATDYYRLSAEMLVDGYRIEYGWGTYLHTPDGKVYTLDGWNDE